MLARLSRRLRPRRRGPCAFWHLGAARSAVAVLEPTSDEPLLRACATVLAQAQAPGAGIATGLLDAAFVVGALDLPHVVALDRPHAAMLCEPAPQITENECEYETVTVAVRGRDGARATARAASVREVGAAFARARLDLAAVDCADCARASLADFLGRDHGSARDERRPAPDAIDPLTAVSVDPACEADAVAHASDLVVPVGLALARFGLVYG